MKDWTGNEKSIYVTLGASNHSESKRADLDLSYAEDNEQVAEWLEELKAYRAIGTVEGCKNSVLDIEKAYNKAIDEFANWLVEQGILGNRCILDGEITDYGKAYAKKYKKQLKERKK